MNEEPGIVKRLMAKRCDICLPCRYARANPDTRIGKAIAWHGSWCPFWKAWQEVYGQRIQDDEAAAAKT